MPRISDNVITQPLGKGEPVDLTIEHTLVGSLFAVAFFGFLSMLNSPYAIMLGKGFIVATSIAAIGGIALIGRHKGALTPDDRENARGAR
jgi:hypothetical protein